MTRSTLQLRTESLSFDQTARLSGTERIAADAEGAAGPTHLVSVVNASVMWQGRDGSAVQAQGLQDLFAPLAPQGVIFDPRVLYDAEAGRFVLIALEVAGLDTLTPADDGARILVAASRSGDPSAGWHTQAIAGRVDVAGTGHFPDYPFMAVSGQALYISANLESFGSIVFGGSRLWILDKDALYAGQAPAPTVLDPTGSTVKIEAHTLVPAQIRGTGPGDADMVLVAYNGRQSEGQDALTLVSVRDPLGTPQVATRLVGMGDVDAEAQAMPDAPQGGGARGLHTGGRRNVYDAEWRDGALHVVTQVVPETGPDAGQATTHWVRLSGATVTGLTVADQGNLGGEDIALGTHTFFPSLGVDAAGTMGIGFSAAGPLVMPGAWFAARAADDPAGTMGTPAPIAAGGDFYDRSDLLGRNRWGDFSGTDPDPVTPGLFHAHNQYAQDTAASPSDAWGTAWGTLSTGGTGPTMVLNGAVRVPIASARADLGLQWDLLATAGADVVAGTAENDFVNGLGGDDGLDGGIGNDILDGGPGSNFLTGGPGTDRFFLDGRGADGAGGTAVWSTVTDRTAGETVTVWGWQDGVSRRLVVTEDGTAGYRGATVHVDVNADGVIDASITFTGQPDTGLAFTPGVVDGSGYLLIG